MPTQSTSNTFSYVDTVETIVNDACSKLGFLGEDEVLSPSESALAIRSANRILKEFMVTARAGGGVKMWQRQRGNMFLSATTGTYVLQAGQSYWCNTFVVLTSNGMNSPGATTINVANSSNLSSVTVGMTLGLMLDTGQIQYTTVNSVSLVANTITLNNPIATSMNSISDLIYAVTDGSSQPPQEIESIVLRDSQGNDTPVRKLNYEDWFNLPSKQAPGFTGDPVGVYYESHLVGSTPFGYLYTDVAAAQDTTKYLYIAYIREIQDLVNQNDLVELPKEWYRSFVYELAFDLCDDFNVIWTSSNEKKRISSAKIASKANPRTSTMGFKTGLDVFLDASRQPYR